MIIEWEGNEQRSKSEDLPKLINLHAFGIKARDVHGVITPSIFPCICPVYFKTTAMKNKFLLTILFCLSLFQSKAQFSESDIKFWVGSGPDTALLVIDFLDGTADTSYAWGYLFDASSNLTAETMLSAINSAEPKLSIATGSGFLNDIVYNNHEGFAGSPNYWGTWNGSNSGNWVTNAGLGEVLSNGSWFGCSYTDFNPAIKPGTPISAYASSWFNKEDVNFWVGTGSDSAVLVIDFVEGIYGEVATFAWGVAFDGNITGENMLTSLANADQNITTDMGGGFLNDIIYGGYEGLAGEPHYWGTWSGTNLSDWIMNSGINTVVNDGDWFGCTYEAWAPRRPFVPFAATNPESFLASDILHWEGMGSDSSVIVIDFNDGNEAVAFGYISNGMTTANQALNDLADAYSSLTVGISGEFLNDIEYDSQSGIGGTNGFYWGTWSGTNAANWTPNTGLSELLNNGSWFGCSFTDFEPNTPPTAPKSAIAAVGIHSVSIDMNWTIFSSNKQITISLKESDYGRFKIYDIAGNLIIEHSQIGSVTNIDMGGLPSAIYMVQYINEKGADTKKVVLF